MKTTKLNWEEEFKKKFVWKKDYNDISPKLKPDEILDFIRAVVKEEKTELFDRFAKYVIWDTPKKIQEPVEVPPFGVIHEAFTRNGQRRFQLERLKELADLERDSK